MFFLQCRHAGLQTCRHTCFVTISVIKFCYIKKGLTISVCMLYIQTVIDFTNMQIGMFCYTTCMLLQAYRRASFASNSVLVLFVPSRAM